MKKSVSIMLLILMVLCIIYSVTDVKAAESVTNTNSVIDIGEGTEQTTESSTEEVGEQESTDKKSSSKFGVISEDTQSNTKTTTKDTTNNNSETSKPSSYKSGKESVDDAFNSNEVGIMGDDWEFGDEMLPKVESEGFFERIYNKLWGVTTAAQKVVCVISIIFFLIDLIMILASALGNRSKLPWYLFALVICLMIFVASIYAPQIASAFNNWFMSD